MISLLLFLNGLLVLAVATPITDTDCETSVYIGDKYYRSSVLANVSLFNRIVVDNDSNIFYRTDQDKNMYVWKKGEAAAQKIDGLTAGMAQDSIMDSAGNILISTTRGIYKYNYTTSKAEFFKAENHILYKMTIVENGSVYATNNYNTMYHINEEEVKQFSTVPKASTITFNSDGDLFYVSGIDKFPYVLRHGHREPVRIAGVKSSTTYLLATDPTNNYIYLCHDDGLYYVKPDSHYTKRVKGYNRAQAMGFDSKGVMYLGTMKQMLKLEPLARNPCDSQDVVEPIESTPKVSVKDISGGKVDNNNNNQNMPDVAHFVSNDVRDNIESLKEKNSALVAMTAIHSIGFLLLGLAVVVYVVRRRHGGINYRPQENARDTVLSSSSIEYSGKSEEFVNFQ